MRSIYDSNSLVWLNIQRVRATIQKNHTTNEMPNFLLYQLCLSNNNNTQKKKENQKWGHVCIYKCYHHRSCISVIVHKVVKWENCSWNWLRQLMRICSMSFDVHAISLPFHLWRLESEPSVRSQCYKKMRKKKKYRRTWNGLWIMSIVILVIWRHFLYTIYPLFWPFSTLKTGWWFGCVFLELGAIQAIAINRQIRIREWSFHQIVCFGFFSLWLSLLSLSALAQFWQKHKRAYWMKLVNGTI